jgi:hypothetical protein
MSDVHVAVPELTREHRLQHGSEQRPVCVCFQKHVGRDREPGAESPDLNGRCVMAEEHVDRPTVDGSLDIIVGECLLWPPILAWPQSPLVNADRSTQSHPYMLAEPPSHTARQMVKIRQCLIEDDRLEAVIGRRHRRHLEHRSPRPAFCRSWDAFTQGRSPPHGSNWLDPARPGA